MGTSDTAICIVGAGNVATHLAKALKGVDFDVCAIYSRTQDSASALAAQVGATAVTTLGDLPQTPIYIYAVKDDILPTLAAEHSALRPEALHVHTSGSTDLHVFSPNCRSYGVLYPMQTFSKQAKLDFRRIPCFVEGNSDEAQARITELAQCISENVRALDSEKRRYLHLAAVFACNFVNHCYAVAGKILEEGAGLPFDVLLPLTDETAAKVHQLPPQTAQTGPAVRFDRNILDKHLQLLENDNLRAELYRILSESIHDFAEAVATGK